MSRIIAGRARGRRLVMPSHQQTRPTTDRVREAVFSALASWADGLNGADDALAGLAFLDLYAGSGAVGLEAASRGAGPVCLVEADRKTAEIARQNARTLGLAAEVRTMKVEALLEGAAPRAYDIIWADPPYDVPAEVLDRHVVRLAERGWIAPHGLVILERSIRGAGPDWPPALGKRWDRRYGETILYFAEEGDT